jgi:hypothetical protein
MQLFVCGFNINLVTRTKYSVKCFFSEVFLIKVFLISFLFCEIISPPSGSIVSKCSWEL